MNPYAKCVLAGIHFIALGCLVVSIVFYASEFAHVARNISGPHQSSNPWMLALKGVPALIGLVLFWKGKRMATYCTRDLD